MTVTLSSLDVGLQIGKLIAPATRRLACSRSASDARSVPLPPRVLKKCAPRTNTCHAQQAREGIAGSKLLTELADLTSQIATEIARITNANATVGKRGPLP